MLLDGEPAEDGGTDPIKRFVRNSVAGDLLDFNEDFTPGELDLRVRGGDVEGEQPGVVAEELGGSDLIGEAEFLADAAEGSLLPTSLRRSLGPCGWVR